LTALYGQTGNQDTLTCYNNSELKLIAKRVIRANECDTLLILSNALIYVKDSIISTLNLSVSGKDSIIGIIESINNDYSGVITLKSNQIKTLNKSVKKLSRKNKFLKVGWGVSLLAVLVGVLTLSL
tara:strand:- start:103 stop:480 length:378 start_codon:yes stop_codon:yes gene_type:complete